MRRARRGRNERRENLVWMGREEAREGGGEELRAMALRVGTRARCDGLRSNAVGWLLLLVICEIGRSLSTFKLGC